MSHAFFSLREKYPSAAKGDEGLVHSWETTATPSVAALLVPLEGGQCRGYPSVAALLVPLEEVSHYLGGCSRWGRVCVRVGYGFFVSGSGS